MTSRGYMWIINSIENATHDSQSSRENSTASSGTSLPAPFKEVHPRDKLLQPFLLFFSRGRGRGRGVRGRPPYKKDGRNQDPVLWEWLQIFFLPSPSEVPNLNQHITKRCRKSSKTSHFRGGSRIFLRRGCTSQK